MPRLYAGGGRARSAAPSRSAEPKGFGPGWCVETELCRVATWPCLGGGEVGVDHCASLWRPVADVALVRGVLPALIREGAASHRREARGPDGFSPVVDLAGL